MKTFHKIVAASFCLVLPLLPMAPAYAASTKPVPSRPGVASASSEGVVNINEASADELSRLPGVGPARARAIVELRRTRPFHHPEEITRVKGIGRKMFGRMRPYVAVAGLTTLKRRPTK